MEGSIYFILLINFDLFQNQEKNGVVPLLFHFLNFTGIILSTNSDLGVAVLLLVLKTVTHNLG